jgi:signal peptidase I
MPTDPIPEEELPPRLRFERMVEGPEPRIFPSVRPAEGSSPPVDPPEETPTEPESDESILQRFEALKRTLGDELTESEVRPAVPAAPASQDRGNDRTLDELQERVRGVRQQEREATAGADPLPPAADESDGPALTYDEIEAHKQAEAARARREAKKEKRRLRRKNRSFWQELPILILVALVVAIIIKTFFFQAFYIPSGSMIPTLEINDRVLVNKLSYRFGAIERGDILVFDSPEAIDVERSFPARVLRSIGEATGLTSPDTVLIKRVIGLPGETVAVVDNQVYVNGSPIAEPYLPENTTMRDFEEVSVPADHVFMMGDNRNQSRDSRFFGAIPRDDIVGRAFVSVWPPGAWGGL